jgi:phosphoglycerate dehydrogenase-like enzyme
MRLLISGAISWTEKQVTELEALGHVITYIQDERVPLRTQEIDEENIDGVICNSLFLYNNISEFKNLKYIQLTSAGFDRVPLDYIKEHNIKIYNARGVYSKPMAEFALSGVLQLYKKSYHFFENQKKHIWKKYRDIIELADKSVCIIGCGSVGKECAKRFKAFECKVYGVDLYPKEDDNFDKIFHLNELEIILPQSDVVVLTLPLTEKTKYLINEYRLGLLKRDAILVNIARGKIVDTEALIARLPDLGGAVLDVFEEEPLSSDSLLWRVENVIITPHSSFIGEGNRNRLQKLILHNMEIYENE